MKQPAIGADTFVLVLTGAGVSAESGIPTFRGSGGLWNDHRFEELASPEGFARDPALVWRFYSWRRSVAAGCAPNPGHAALAALEQRLGDHFLLATQNVDGLHRAAGNTRVLELHGNLFTSRCSRCDRPPFEDRALHEARAPACDRCGGLLRPHIVWFGEALDPSHFEAIEAFLERARAHPLVFLAAGTSGVVYPAAGLVDVARRFGAETWLVNADPPDNAHRFQHFVQGRSGEVLPALLAP
ncbi:MAG: NAD-dependent deacylase [Myxococcaceae bacterium]|nr:NAD-dependent deacylase [Myxococcaceae bacterium]